MNSKEPPYDYCALSYAIQWETHERALHQEISRKPSAEAIRKSLSYFKVARVFPRLERKADLAESALIRSSKGLNEGNVVKRVADLTNEFFFTFNKKNLSAASKLLWLRCQHPYSSWTHVQ